MFSDGVDVSEMERNYTCAPHTYPNDRTRLKITLANSPYLASRIIECNPGSPQRMNSINGDTFDMRHAKAKCSITSSVECTAFNVTFNESFILL